VASFRLTRPHRERRIACNQGVCAIRFYQVPAHVDQTASLALILTSRIPGGTMTRLSKLWMEEGGQDIAEYAVMLAVILVLVVGTIRLVGSNANNAFSAAASSIQ